MRHLRVALDQAAEEQAVHAFRLRFGADARIEVRRHGLDQEVHRARLGLRLPRACRETQPDAERASAAEWCGIIDGRGLCLAAAAHSRPFQESRGCGSRRWRWGDWRGRPCTVSSASTAKANASLASPGTPKLSDGIISIPRQRGGDLRAEQRIARAAAGDDELRDAWLVATPSGGRRPTIESAVKMVAVRTKSSGCARWRRPQASSLRR